IPPPYVLAGCPPAIDGYIDHATDARPLLANDADIVRGGAVRAACDAILVGAHTIRRDNPRLLVRSAARRAGRAARGRRPSPTKVTLTGGGDLDPDAAFFTAGDADRLVYCASAAVDKARVRVGDRATVVDAG